MKHSMIAVAGVVAMMLAAGPVQAAININGAIGAGEWNGATSWNASGIGTVSVLNDSTNLYVLFNLTDSTDARLGQNVKGNDQVGFNVNPTNGGSWGFPYDLIFQTGADPNAWGGGNSGNTDGWKSQLKINNVVHWSLPAGLVTETLYGGGTRVSEWQIPLSIIGSGAEVGDTLRIGGAVDVGNGNSYVFPVGLQWSNASTYGEYTVVPEPATIIVWSVLGLAAAGYGLWRRKRAG